LQRAEFDDTTRSIIHILHDPYAVPKQLRPAAPRPPPQQSQPVRSPPLPALPAPSPPRWSSPVIAGSGEVRFSGRDGWTQEQAPTHRVCAASEQQPRNLEVPAVAREVQRGLAVRVDRAHLQKKTHGGDRWTPAAGTRGPQARTSAPASISEVAISRYPPAHASCSGVESSSSRELTAAPLHATKKGNAASAKIHDRARPEVARRLTA